MKIDGNYIMYTEDGYTTIALSFAEIDAMPKEKENALIHYVAVIARSWTFARMTPEERDNLMGVFEDVRTVYGLRGNWEARWNILQAVYGAFLAALGYRGGDWRDKADE